MAGCSHNSLATLTKGSEGWPMLFLGHMEAMSFVDGWADDSSARGDL
jgi:hypothetical protein